MATRKHSNKTSGDINYSSKAPDVQSEPLAPFLVSFLDPVSDFKTLSLSLLVSMQLASCYKSTFDPMIMMSSFKTLRQAALESKQVIGHLIKRI